jgi:protein-L-isoaspartate(D-aspartate) O-methyltransferase
MDQLSAADQANQLMVDLMIAEGALWSPPLIAAFRATPRHRFLDRIYQFQAKHNRWREIITREPGLAELRLIYADRALITHVSSAKQSRTPIPISSSSQPTLMAQMLEDLRLAAGQKVLEIGAGTGYNAALLAHVVGPELVTSVDVDRSVLSEAWDHLRGFPERGVNLKQADGRLGLSELAPYDRIMVTAATPHLEQAWLEQLAPNGVLSAPLALAPGLAFVICGTVADEIFEGRLVRAAYFMPLRAEDDLGVAEDTSTETLDGLETAAAPWSEWLERRRGRIVWLRLAQSLAFYAWLRGLTVAMQAQPDGQVMFGIGDADGEASCWLGTQRWHFNDARGRRLGWRLWQAFLDAGGPWPTEFTVRVALHGEVALTGAKEEYIRPVSGRPYVWTLLQPRSRPTWL